MASTSTLYTAAAWQGTCAVLCSKAAWRMVNSINTQPNKYDDQSSRAWLYGKLFVALLRQRLARVGKSISPRGYLLPQPTHTQIMA